MEDLMFRTGEALGFFPFRPPHSSDHIPPTGANFFSGLDPNVVVKCSDFNLKETTRSQRRNGVVAIALEQFYGIVRRDCRNLAPEVWDAASRERNAGKAKERSRNCGATALSRRRTSHHLYNAIQRRARHFPHVLRVYIRTSTRIANGNRNARVAGRRRRGWDRGRRFGMGRPFGYRAREDYGRDHRASGCR